ncbi:hypothetical protein BJ962_006874 [Streptomyces aureorectus]|nr:hypothetical protein [Streptomyces calvus]
MTIQMPAVELRYTVSHAAFPLMNSFMPAVSVETDVVPDQHDPASKLECGRGRPGRGESRQPKLSGSSLRPPILADRIDELGPLAWLEAGHDRHRHPPGSPARTRATRL